MEMAGQDIYEYFRKTIRIHIPIITNNDVIFYCNDAFFNMRSGEVWAINNLSKHGVINQHPTIDRYHIIVDMYPNTDLLSLLQIIRPAPGIEPGNHFHFLFDNNYCAT